MAASATALFDSMPFELRIAHMRRHRSGPPGWRSRTLLMECLIRVERVELRRVHGQLVPVSICTPASSESPIDLDRDGRGCRIFLPD